tara:strand:- start:409 stop:651 length:243 start_codon:yes stop_codon:yes gene_type:complete
MINKEEIVDQIIAKDLKVIYPFLNEIKDCAQKDYIKNFLSEFKKNRTGDLSEFIEGFAKIKGEKIDIESLKEKLKNYNNG